LRCAIFYCDAKSFSPCLFYPRLIACTAAAGPCRGAEPLDHPAKEAPMELKTRLNVLAAIMSFGFVAAIVFGMI
jgi:hypothetical protein